MAMNCFRTNENSLSKLTHQQTGVRFSQLILESRIENRCLQRHFNHILTLSQLRSAKVAHERHADQFGIHSLFSNVFAYLGMYAIDGSNIFTA